MSLRNVELQTLALHVGSPRLHYETGRNIPLPKAGVLTNPGISIFGDAVEGEKGTVTIYPPHSDSKQPSIPSLFIKGDTKQEGDINVSGSITASNEVTASGITLTSRKPFDIPHPSKSGYRLRHVCIEGPESGVYYRGRLKGSNIIKLPDYWEQLVHVDSITVQLQPIGDRHFHLNVVSFDNKEIIIKEADDKPIDCFYHVYGERKDGEKLIVEYKGISIDDYPGDNSIYSINK
tara:strand:- start:61 stop:762 length:702 start_codon:yes stop_codon:yes gene_type:complete